MQEPLEPEQRVPVPEDHLRNARAVNLAVLAEDLLTEALDHRPLDALVFTDQPMDDLVTRDDGGSMPRERGERLALSRSDAAGDRDGDGTVTTAARRSLPAPARRPSRRRIPQRRRRALARRLRRRRIPQRRRRAPARRLRRRRIPQRRRRAPATALTPSSERAL